MLITIEYTNRLLTRAFDDGKNFPPLDVGNDFRQEIFLCTQPSTPRSRVRPHFKFFTGHNELADLEATGQFIQLIVQLRSGLLMLLD